MSDLTPTQNISNVPGTAFERATAGIRLQHKLLADQSQVIRAQAHTIREMDKIVGNMHDLVKSLQSDKAKEKERIAALKRFEFGKNPNYAQSVWIGFREAVIFFPTYLVRGMKAPLLLFAQAVFQSLGFLLAAVVGAPTLIVMGLFGHMKPKPKAKS